MVDTHTNKKTQHKVFKSPTASKTDERSREIIHSCLLSYPERWGGGDPPRLETQHRATDCGLTVTLMVAVVVEEGEGALGRWKSAGRR